ncbi:MAG TPA: NADH-quinone oxidoreductase subunit A [Candidatus Dormibacteraeota bacterium]|nr:NADH-quinone oxidoreductase subunit A [Candidatus Dormibacteraeota bacterium]
MPYPVAAILELVAIAVAVPAVTLGVAVLLGGRPSWLDRDRRGRRAEPDIHTFLMLAVLAVVDLGLVFLVPFAVAFGGLHPHRDTALVGLFMAVLTLLGVGYAWRRGVLRWS